MGGKLSEVALVLMRGLDRTYQVRDQSGGAATLRIWCTVESSEDSQRIVVNAGLADGLIQKVP
jgi:hypothetical protein